MNKKLFFIFLGLALSHVTLAGNVQLSATRNICKLEVREGYNGNPENNPIVFAGAVNSGWSFKSQDGTQLSYRRGGHWDDCIPNSWTHWKTEHNSLSGTEYKAID